MQLDMMLLSMADLTTAGAYARAIEEMGFAALWTAETQHNPFLPLAVAATTTHQLQLGTAIAVAFPRSPTITAMSAWSLQRLSGGRFILGLGMGYRPLEFNGTTYQAPNLNGRRGTLSGTLTVTKKALAMRGGAAKSDAAAPEEVNGHKFLGQIVDGLDPKDLRSTVDTMKQRVGSGVAALVAVNEGRASVAVGVTDDLAKQVSAVDLVKAAVAMLGGQGGGGRPDMAQGGGPDGSKAKEALDAVRDALEKVAA